MSRGVKPTRSALGIYRSPKLHNQATPFIDPSTHDDMVRNNGACAT